jgi:hypothetical protein
MMPRAPRSRRGLVATAVFGGVAWLSGCVSFLVTRGDAGAWSVVNSGTLLAVCSELGPSSTIGKACLEALPATETSAASLARIILGESDGTDCSSAGALARSIRERSRHDFREGRIVTVDGWMLSLTETRVYALAALLPRADKTVE